MARPVTLCTGQWADLPVATLAEKAKTWGYDGLELCCWGDHFSPTRALNEKDYCEKHREVLAARGIGVWALSNHLAGQMVLDPNDSRTDDWVPADCAKDPESKRRWAIDEMKRTAEAAQKFGVGVVNGFTGSSVWPLLYSFPPVSPKDIEAGFQLLAERWNPILDVFKACGVKFALEVHPTEIAFDLHTAIRAVEVLDGRPEFGFNLDPSHLHWQGVNPVEFVRQFPDRIYHCHMKDAIVTLDGRSGILSSHLNFGDPRRGWDFRSLGRGGVNFEEMIRALNQAGYTGPLSVEWEDSGMDREHGAKEACEFVRELDFEPSKVAFDAAFAEEREK